MGYHKFIVGCLDSKQRIKLKFYVQFPKYQNEDTTSLVHKAIRAIQKHLKPDDILEFNIQSFQAEPLEYVATYEDCNIASV